MVSAQNEEADGSGARITALDGLRGIAILLVLVRHFPLAWYTTSGSPLDEIFMRVAGIGWIGVDLFFVLSGFLITRILWQAKDGGGAYFKSFYARRFLRIFPAYYVFLVFLIVLLPLLPEMRDRPDLAALTDAQWWFWTYMHNMRGAFEPVEGLGHFSNGHLWSLAVEEQFYLVWPFVVLAFNRRNLMIVCAGMIVAALALRIAIQFEHIPGINPFYTHVLTFTRMDALALGALLALAAEHPPHLAIARRAALPAAVASIAGLAGIGMVTGTWTLPPYDIWTQTIGLTLVALLAAAAITWTVTSSSEGRLHRIGASGPLVSLGKYSYGMYIVHFQLMVLLTTQINQHGGMRLAFGMEWPWRVLFLCVGTLISFAIAWVSWHVLERHFLGLKRYFPYRSDEADVHPAPAAASLPPAVADLPSEAAGGGS